MLANFFGKSKPVNFIVLFILFLVYLSFSLISKEFSINIIKELVGFITIFSVYNFIVAKNQLTFDNSYAFLFFILLIGFFLEIIKINNTFFSFLTILLFLRKVYSLKSSKNILHKLFDGGLWLGISFLIEPITVFFGILLCVSIYIHQRFTYQTLLSPIIGFIAPVFLFFTYCFWYDKTADFDNLFNWNLSLNLNYYTNTKYLFSFFFIGILTLFSIIMKNPKALAVLNTFRKNWVLILIHFTTAIVVTLYIKDKNTTELLFVFFPVSIILANGIELFKKKKWLIDIMLIVIFTCSILVNFL